MLSDPWSRPTLEDLRRIERSSRFTPNPIASDARRFPCCIPAELITARGNSISAMTHEIGPASLSLIHKGFLPLGTAQIRLASERDALVYTARVEFSIPCALGLFRSEIAIVTKEYQ